MNGYPDRVIDKTIARTLYDFVLSTLHTMNKCPVFLRLPWLGTLLFRLENKTKASVEKCFFAVGQHVIFTSLPLLPAIK